MKVFKTFFSSLVTVVVGSGQIVGMPEMEESESPMASEPMSIDAEEEDRAAILENGNSAFFTSLYRSCFLDLPPSVESTAPAPGIALLFPSALYLNTHSV